jgi:hypothetical protein
LYFWELLISHNGKEKGERQELRNKTVKVTSYPMGHAVNPEKST